MPSTCGGKGKRDPLEVFETALRNATPMLEVKARRWVVSKYQVPMEVEPGRALSLAMRWLLAAARSRGGQSIAEKLACRIHGCGLEQGQPQSSKKKETHRMAEANRAFASLSLVNHRNCSKEHGE
jgi:small subunit ribosomal protein S7